MSWFLVILLWSPATMDFEASRGRVPAPSATEYMCQRRLDIAVQFLPVHRFKPLTGCVSASSQREANKILREIVQ